MRGRGRRVAALVVPLAVARGKVYFGDVRGYLYAVDRNTGRLDWARRLDSTVGAIVTSSPLVFGR